MQRHGLCRSALVLLVAMGGNPMTSSNAGDNAPKNGGTLPQAAARQGVAAQTDPTAARYAVRVERNRPIPMRDGKKLAADFLRPDAEGRFPVILEYIPYRKDDVSRGAFDALHYFAERGFVAVRLDVRGTGGSEGFNTDEYVAQEQADGIDAVEWLGTQPWCNGNVGMFGTSYGGFTCVQVAMHRPPHLKAIVPMYATDDRYTDDCHYTPGGNMRMYYDVGTYGGSMVAMNALPPSLDLAGAEWAELWKERLEKNEPYLLKWMKHQVDGPYWRTASLRPGYERIACPTFLIGGWHDGYANAMLRMYVKLKSPRKLLMGPWVHSRPNASTPGPRIDYLREIVRFFAETLDGKPTGSLSEPPVTVYMQEFATPDRTLQNVPGHWRNEQDIAPSTGGLRLYLQAGGRLAAQPAEQADKPYEELDYLPTVGTANGFWSAGGMAYYLPDDQRADEAYSLNFTSEPLPQDVNILGWPQVVLYGSSTARVATFVAKLSDVAPDGTSALIADGSLNATRRKSLTDPEPLSAESIYKLEIPMPPTGWALPAGHRLRLSISGGDFPNLWPTPEKGRHRVHFGKNPSHVILPVVQKSKLEPPRFLPAPVLQSYGKSYGTPPMQTVTHDQISGTVTVANRMSGTTALDDQRGTLLSEHSFRCTASSRDPAKSSIVGTHKFSLTRDGDVIEVVSESSVRATATTFHILVTLNVLKNGQPFFQKSWSASEPRKML